MSVISLGSFDSVLQLSHQIYQMAYKSANAATVFKDPLQHRSECLYCT